MESSVNLNIIKYMSELRGVSIYIDAPTFFILSDFLIGLRNVLYKVYSQNNKSIS